LIFGKVALEWWSREIFWHCIEWLDSLPAIITGTKAKIYSRLQINEVQDLNSKPDSKPVLLLTRWILL